MSLLPGSHKLGCLDYNKSRLAKNSFTNLVPKGIEEITSSFDEVFNF